MLRIVPASLVPLALALLACASAPPPTPAELRALDSPPSAVAARVEAKLRLLQSWYVAAGERIVAEGRPLTPAEREIATGVGVREPERVRVLVTASFPLPEEAEARAAALRLGLGASAEGGRTHVYGVVLKPKYAGQTWILAHELTHVAQIERLGVEPFLRRYLTEIELLGYARSPLEREADGEARRVR